ncbi:MAG: STAS domain-containing protein [Phycisphaerales bacterium]|nr:STAS domain-containing protein [Phycisphaerales bacterium]
MSGPNIINPNLAVLDRLGETAVVTLTIEVLSGDETALMLRELLTSVYQQGNKHFILDLQNVSSMDSVCVGVLVEMLTQMQQTRGGGRIALVNADGNVAYLFRITRLDRVFPICRDVMTALTAVEHASAA